MMVETARKVVRDEIIEPKLDMAYDRSGDFPHEIYKKLWEQGLVQLSSLRVSVVLGSLALSTVQLAKRSLTVAWA